MQFHKAWLWVAAGGVVALVFVSVAVPEPAFRALLSVLAIVPLLYVSVRVALGSERQVAHERRRYMKLRNVTDEFIMHVRNLNRITVIAKGESPPEDAEGMIDDIIDRMHKLVDRMRDAAGQESIVIPEQKGD
ncbi:MAG: hypothetical protein GTO46_13925 [Gemmatimonadetes bacterium]|nr:hypothetical protein [Gemmatimonadota bacterium]NIO32683.1 hypothetical protein [Gemmatimonadota bacterium]